MFVDTVRGAARGAWNLGLETYEQWRDHRTIRLGAVLAYYGLFAIVPMLAVALALAGRVISQGDVQSYLAEQLSTLLGVDADTVAHPQRVPGVAVDLLRRTDRAGRCRIHSRPHSPTFGCRWARSSVVSLP